jgi:DNA-binding NarL/FixJ family response regulator
MKLSVYLADDHAITISGIEKMLADHPLIELSGTYMSGDALLKALESKTPDVILLDIQMPGRQGDELAKIISEQYPTIAILTLTNMDMVFHVRNMFVHGARGYLLKSATRNTLVEAITVVSRGEQYIDIALREKMAYELTNKRAQFKSMLTKREQKILELIAEEKTNTEIAEELFVSQRTVENHRTNLFFKLGVKNSAGLIKKAIQMGLIKL